MSQINLDPIGVIRTPFKQKFAIPRQPNLVNAKGTIMMQDAYSDARVFKGLQHYSHLWLIFHFNETFAQGWKPVVKAPRLGGNKTLGVFASRSTFRPNGLGMSVVKNLGYRKVDAVLLLDVEGVDLLDHTPIFDIKPYLPYADAISNSKAEIQYGEQIERPDTMPVAFSPDASKQIEELKHHYHDLDLLIEQVLSQDPRPAYKRRRENDDKTYVIQLYEVDIHWRVYNQQITVERLTPLVSHKG